RTISWLKQENQGRATFLPLTSIRAKHISKQAYEKMKEHEGFVAVASEAVQRKTRYKIVREHLLGNVCIAKDLKAANEIAKRTNHAHRIVTSEGDMIFPGGSMTCESIKKGKINLMKK